MKTKTVLLFLIVLFSGICRIHAQADFYLMQALGSRYIYNSDYFEETREMQVYLSGVDGSLKRDSLLAIYVLDAQSPHIQFILFNIRVDTSQHTLYYCWNI